MKKYLLIFFTLIIAIFLSSCLRSENNQNSPSIKIIAKTDKSIYSSYEKINLDIKITASQELNEVAVLAQGISVYGRNYFDESQTINLAKGKTQNLEFTETLPSCNSCSGLRPGNYVINISASHQGKILSEEIISINIKQ